MLEEFTHNPDLNFTHATVTPTVIAVRKLTKQYKKSGYTIEALNDINFDVNRGQLVALVGSSGSGKSTILHILAGLDRQTKGEVCINGTSLKMMKDREASTYRNQKIGFVFQSFFLQPFLTVRQNIEVAAMPSQIKANLLNKRIYDLSIRLGTSDLLDRYPKELSGGQIQRIAIVRALVNSPLIVLADEPTGNLDAVNSSRVVDLFLKICRETGTTVIIATHDEKIAELADKVIRIDKGSLV